MSMKKKEKEKITASISYCKREASRHATLPDKIRTPLESPVEVAEVGVCLFQLVLVEHVPVI